MRFVKANQIFRRNCLRKDINDVFESARCIEYFMYYFCQELASSLPPTLDFNLDNKSIHSLLTLEERGLLCSTAIRKNFKCFNCYNALKRHLIGFSQLKDVLQVHVVRNQLVHVLAIVCIIYLASGGDNHLL